MAPVVIRKHRASWGPAARWAGLATGFSIALAIGLIALPCSARADEAAPAENSTVPGAPDKSNYTLLNPTPDDQMRKFAPDRPTKGFSVRTVDAGDRKSVV